MEASINEPDLYNYICGPRLYCSFVAFYAGSRPVLRVLRMKWNKKFEYPKSQRSLIEGKRHYDIGNDKLPSVTTILSATQSEEKTKSLADWKARLGD